MLDVLSGARLEVGVGRGIDFQEGQKLGMDFDELRPRFQEGMGLMLKAWTQAYLEHDGAFYSLARTAVYPRPLQEPHPPVWVAAESPATSDWVASRGFGVSTIFLPTAVVAEKLDHYLGLAKEAGGRSGGEAVMVFRKGYLAPTRG